MGRCRGSGGRNKSSITIGARVSSIIGVFEIIISGILRTGGKFIIKWFND